MFARAALLASSSEAMVAGSKPTAVDCRAGLKEGRAPNSEPVSDPRDPRRGGLKVVVGPSHRSASKTFKSHVPGIAPWGFQCEEPTFPDVPLLLFLRFAILITFGEIASDAAMPGPLASRAMDDLVWSMTFAIICKSTGLSLKRVSTDDLLL